MSVECTETRPATDYGSDAPRNRFYLVGVSDIRSENGDTLSKGIAGKLSVPLVSNTVETVLNNTAIPFNGKLGIDQIFELYGDILDQLEVGLVIHQGGAVFNLTPLGMFAAVHGQLIDSRFKVTKGDLAAFNRLKEKSINLSNRFTHLVLGNPFKTTEPRFLPDNIMTNLIMGLHYRYEPQIGCPLIRLPEVLATDEERIDFATRVITLL